LILLFLVLKHETSEKNINRRFLLAIIIMILKKPVIEEKKKNASLSILYIIESKMLIYWFRLICAIYLIF